MVSIFLVVSPMLLLATWIVPICTASCPVVDCDFVGSGFLPDQLPTVVQPMNNLQAWSVPCPRARCSSVDGIVACTSLPSPPPVDLPSHPGVSTTPASRLVAAINGSTGDQLWISTHLSADATPLIGQSGPIVLSNGYQLLGLTLAGDLVGPLIPILPPLGPVWSTTVTTNDVFILASTHRDTAAYLTNGVPHASIWFNATEAGTPGTFVVVAQPRVVETRVYLLTRFLAANTSALPSVPPSTACRLYALDVNREIVQRLQVAWFWSFSCNTSVESFPLAVARQYSGTGAATRILFPGLLRLDLLRRGTSSAGLTPTLYSLDDLGSSARLASTTAGDLGSGVASVGLIPSQFDIVWLTCQDDPFILRNVNTSTGQLVVALDVRVHIQADAVLAPGKAPFRTASFVAGARLPRTTGEHGLLISVVLASPQSSLALAAVTYVTSPSWKFTTIWTLISDACSPTVDGPCVGATSTTITLQTSPGNGSDSKETVLVWPLANQIAGWVL